MRYIVCILLFLGINSAFAAKVDTVETVSASMNKKIKAVIITPDDYTSGKDFPVLYLLHGYSGNYSNWPTRTAISQLADRYHMMVVCPDGGFGSWYLDSPVDKN